MTIASDALEVAFVDTIDACHMKCPTCVRGLRVMPNTSAKMDMEMFGAVVDKLKIEGYPLIGLFSWTEPFLNRTLEDYVALVKGRGLRCWISTTLALRHIDNLEATMVAGTDVMLVSISGMDQATYQVNHVGGRLAHVFDNLKRAAEIVRKRDLSTIVRLKFLKFDHNGHQVAEARAFADEVGIDFEVIDGGGNPLDTSQTRQLTDQFFRGHNAEAGTSPEANGKTCGLMFDQISIDCKGDIYICCAFPMHPSLRIGNYLEMDADQILLRRFTHSFCQVCDAPRREALPSDRARVFRAISAAAQ